MQNKWEALRAWAPGVHAEATTVRDVTRRLRAERRRVGLRPQGYAEVRRYAVLLSLEHAFRAEARR